MRKRTLHDDDELGVHRSWEREELVLVYRPFSCIREKDEVDLNEMATVKSKSSLSS
jgi:hypothetical protein